jgi:hypothetical protein|tara:strand:+ start:486 stop:824 length:339 start_codon:yes stop_codon:yes gene_type:complete
MFTTSIAALAHEMTPTYPVFKGSYISGVSVTTMNLFNKRRDIAFYEIGVFTAEWEPIPFVSKYTIIPMKYLDTVEFDIYVSNASLAAVEYICSVSKLNIKTTVSSKICSRVK